MIKIILIYNLIYFFFIIIYSITSKNNIVKPINIFNKHTLVDK